LKNKFHYKIFELGSGIAMEIRLFLEKIKELSGSNTILNFGKISYRRDEIMDSKADIQELKNLGWQPKYSVEQGIKQILENYKVIKE